MNPTDDLLTFIEYHPRLVVITGAGISLASGIPTYRDQSGNWIRNQPIQHRDFIDLPASRQRYWARSMAGWPTVAAAEPTPAHHALARLEALGYIKMLVTQNVDGLHQRAGHERVLDLHGRLDLVVCLGCSHTLSREDMQVRLQALNVGVKPAEAPQPDGDADVPQPVIENLRVPDCPCCGGCLKPDVVFFGGSVPRLLVDEIYAAVDQADALLAIGSSLKVFSGFRFCKHASKQGIPICTINPGETRADELATLTIREDCQSLLIRVASNLAEHIVEGRQG